MIVVTHYQRLLDYIVPDFVHVLVGRPHRQVGRQGAGPGARGEGLRLAGARARRSRERGVTVVTCERASRDFDATRGRRAGLARLAPRAALRRASLPLGFPTDSRRGLALHEPRRRSPTDVPAPAPDGRHVDPADLEHAARFGTLRRASRRLRERAARRRRCPPSSATRGVRLPAARGAPTPSAASASLIERRRSTAPSRAQHGLDRGRRVRGDRRGAVRRAAASTWSTRHAPARDARRLRTRDPGRRRRRRQARSSRATSARRARVLHERRDRGRRAGAGAVLDHFKLQRESEQRLPRGARCGVDAGARHAASRDASSASAAPRAQRHPRRARRRGRRVRARRPVHGGRRAAHRQPHRHRSRPAPLHSHELYKGVLDGTPGASSTAGSSSARTRRRPTPTRPTGTCCCPSERPRQHASRSSRSSPTT